MKSYYIKSIILSIGTALLFWVALISLSFGYPFWYYFDSIIGVVIVYKLSLNYFGKQSTREE